MTQTEATTQQVREAARILIDKYVRSDDQRARCLSELENAAPVKTRRGWRFYIPSLGRDADFTATLTYQGHVLVEVSSDDDATWDNV